MSISNLDQYQFEVPKTIEIHPNRSQSNSKTYDDITVLKALEEIKLGKNDLKMVSSKLKIPLKTLRSYVKRYGNNDFQYNKSTPQLTHHKQIFNYKSEEEFKSYVFSSLKISSKLKLCDICKLAYEFAKIKKMNIPESWVETKSAKRKWYGCFLKRHPNFILTILKLQNLTRTTVCYIDKVETFFNAFEQLILNYEFALEHIYYINVITTEINNKLKEKKSLTDQDDEKAAVLTLVTTISSAAEVLPAYFTLSSEVTQSATGSDTGKDDAFIKYLNNFIQYSECSTSRPSLLLMSNDTFNTSLNCENLLRDYGIIVLEFPKDYPQTLKPLDSTFEALNYKLKDQMSKWVKYYPSIEMTSQHISVIVQDIYSDFLLHSKLIENSKVTIDYTANR